LIDWPADKVERRSIDSLIPYARNARTHSDEQIAQIAASIREWGWTVPVLMDKEGGIIAGHGRVLAARKLGLTECPTMCARGWSRAQIQAYIIADNKLTLNAGWDDALLKIELKDLADMGFDLGLTGFDDVELKGLLDTTDGLTDPDNAPDVPEHPVSDAGDLWIMGRHRLLCGDSTVATDVDRVLGGVQPHLMVTDPPYGVNYDPAWREDAAKKGLIGFPPSALGVVANDGRLDWGEAWALFPGDVAYVWHAGRHASAVQASVEAVGFDIRCQIIWAKSSFAISRGHYNWQHEPCWYAVKKGKTGHWHGSKSETTLWMIPHIKNKTGHSTQKPVECMQRPIENNSSPGQAVYEPFSGSGTTIIAADMTGRCCYAIEISPAYVDVAVKRWQDFTGKAATLESDGHTFDQIATERNQPSGGISPASWPPDPGC
jgi:DNA modification methylase